MTHTNGAGTCLLLYFSVLGVVSPGHPMLRIHCFLKPVVVFSDNYLAMIGLSVSVSNERLRFEKQGCD